MYETSQSICPVQSIFGAGFIPDAHTEACHRNLPPVEYERRFADFVRSLYSLVFAQATEH
jgi:hypothetical protein